MDGAEIGGALGFAASILISAVIIHSSLVFQPLPLLFLTERRFFFIFQKWLKYKTFYVVARALARSNLRLNGSEPSKNSVWFRGDCFVGKSALLAKTCFLCLILDTPIFCGRLCSGIVLLFMNAL
jgi:hypothetical protein